MKKSLLFWFSFLLILLIVSYVPVSCKSTPLQNTVTKELTDTSATNVNHQTEINQAIVDSLKYYIGNYYKTGKPECDSVTKLAIENLMRSFNTSKQSGDNGYDIRFDEMKKQLELVLKVGQTKSERTDSIRTQTVREINNTVREVPVTAPLPLWQKVLIWLGVVLLYYQSTKLIIYIKSKFPTNI